MTIKNNSPLILVVDDEVNTTIMLEHIFGREGYRVESANNGVAALRAAKALLPDLILLDILMPGMNGFEVLTHLREDSQTAKIPTVLITANAREPADVARGLNLGADDFLFKPFVPQELVARAQSKIRAHQLEEALHLRTQELEALLRISGMLNQSLEVSQLLELVLNMVLDLIPVDIVAIHQLNDNCESVDTRITGTDDPAITKLFLDPELCARCVNGACPTIWPQASASQPPLIDSFASGMGVLLQQGENLVGVLLVASQTTQYDESDFRLFNGIAQQAALALHNAQLFALQAQYAGHLEDMVEERTAELQSAQQMLVRSEKLAAIGHLAASIAHEIGNPLQPIKLLLNGLSEELEAQNVDVDFREIQMIEENVDRIKRTLDLLLDFARDRKRGTDLGSLNVSGIIQGVIALNHKAFQHAKLKVETDLPDMPPVFGSKDQLESVFMNLMLNAQAAMKAGDSLRISTRSKGGWVNIEFTDTGHGIPPELLDRIFDPFFTTKENGTGLGLSVSYGIIKSHHGTIEVKSKVGKGTTFTIRLPIHRDPAP